MFITLEGSEGAGKSTLINLLKKYFSDKKIDFLFTREPGGTIEGQAIRNILLDKTIELDPYSETFLILADRNEHIDKVIKPALKRNQNILSDRYIDSTFAYQGAGRGIDQKELEYLMRLLNFPKPDLTIYLDLPVEEGLNRVKKRGKSDRFEKEDLIFFERIRNFYLDLVKKNPKRFLLIDASKSTDEVFNLAKDSITNKLYGK
tara:strand:- start:851 stop:1462 length:612 start_codon:yes stop_codon:yes gene_type:complete